MPVLLDTDHLSELKYADSERCVRLKDRLRAGPEEVVAVSIISVEEQMRGWFSAIAKERQAKRQVLAYADLARLFDYFQAFTILLFDERASAGQFDSLKAARIRIATMDLKIAAIALVNQALLLSANLRDFERVPGLQVENWLDTPAKATRKPHEAV